MEIRFVEEVRIYKLVLNPVSGRCEDASVVAISADYDRLVSWYHDQLAPHPWRDDSGYYKVFEEHSPLEWYNPPFSVELNRVSSWGHGISEEWIPMDTYSSIYSSGRLPII